MKKCYNDCQNGRLGEPKDIKPLASSFFHEEAGSLGILPLTHILKRRSDTYKVLCRVTDAQISFIVNILRLRAYPMPLA